MSQTLGIFCDIKSSQSCSINTKGGGVVERFISRKFIMNACIIAGLFVLIWAGKVDPVIALPIMVSAAGIYTAGNVTQKNIQKGE